MENAGFRTEPFFLWIHYFDPHFTYVRHPDFGFADGYRGPLTASLTAGRLDRELRASTGPDRQMDDADLPDSQSAVLELTEEERRQLEALGYVDGEP